MNRISIDPITRLEGHGRIEIFLDDQGDVANAYFQVPELRGFEHFCIGRLAEDMPVITSRICGVCPEAHHMASAKALDALFGVDPPPAGRVIRELVYSAFYVSDHTTHFYALGGPDFIVGPDAPPSERNIFGVVRKVGVEIGKAVIDCRKRNHHAIEMLGGRGIHPVAGVPGGWSRAVTEPERMELLEIARKNIDFALFSLQVFHDIVLSNPAHAELLTSDLFLHRTYYMGMVDDQNRANFYDGMIRIVGPDGVELVKYDANAYLEHIAEHVEPWTYLKFPFLRKTGWKGFVDGSDSGVYCASPLARLNVSDRMATPKAQGHFERFYEAFGCKRVNGRCQPVHHRLATHWARLIEMLYASERMLELAEDPVLTSPEVRRIPEKIVGIGIGCVEAPRGTLTHHYESDERGVLTRVNLVVGTTNNHAPISMSIRRAAEGLIKRGVVATDGLLNRIEMAFRLYDPCLSCATHALPGRMPLVVNVRSAEGELLRTLKRDA
ncbi:MAG: Ni/Fe hydrogenase subunit alpha [Acidobacteriota bacterium]